MGIIVWLLFFLSMLCDRTSGGQSTPEEECIQSSPRTLTKYLVSALCVNASTYQSATAAVECAHAVGRSSLPPKLTVQFCAASGNAAGKHGGSCVSSAAKELTSLDLLPPHLRLSLCLGAPVGAPRGPVQCTLDAGKISRVAGKGTEWLANPDYKTLLCSGAASGAPVSCIEALYSSSKISTMARQKNSHETALALCSKVTSSTPGECASYVLDLPVLSRPDIELIPKLCKLVRPFSAFSQGPANCLRESPSGWSMEKRVELCANALNTGPADCAKLVKGKTSHEITEDHLLLLCRTPKNMLGNSPLKPGVNLSLLLPMAATCVNAAPPMMHADDKIKLCDPSASMNFDEYAESSLSWRNIGAGGVGVPAPAACARAALALRSYSDKAKLCRGAHSTGPAECFSAAPYTMATDMKVNLCSTARSSLPGRCASQVRQHIVSRTIPTVNHHHVEEEDMPQITVPVAPSEAAAAGMVGSDPIDTTYADQVAVELCHGTQSEGTSNCFMKAPHVLDQSLDGGHDLRASLCVDAESDEPARCATTAYNQSVVGRNVQALGAGVIVSLCHNVKSNNVIREVNDTILTEPFNEHSFDEFGPVSCASTMLSSHSLRWWASSDGMLPALVLKLCTHAPSSGPALCAAEAPARFTPQERVDLCREPPKKYYSQSNQSTKLDWLVPASCAMAAPPDIPAYKVIMTCKGANSVTPGHCLRAAPGILTSEDLQRCANAVSIPSEVHVQIYEDMMGVGDAEEARRGSHINSYKAPEVVQSSLTMLEDRKHQVTSAQVNEDKMDQESRDLSMPPGGYQVSSTLRVEATVVDQFQQPVVMNSQQTFQISAPSQDAGIQGETKSLDESVVVDLDRSDTASLRFSLPQKPEDTLMELESKAETEAENQENVIHSPLFSKVISFALKGDVLSSVKVLFASSSDDSTKSSNLSLNFGIEVGKRLARGLSVGLRHDWMNEGLPNLRLVQSVCSNQEEGCQDIVSSLQQVHAHQIGELAGAVVALPFRTGQGFGLALRTSPFIASVLPHTSDTQEEYMEKTVDILESSHHRNAEVRLESEAELEGWSNLGPYFDICLGILFAIGSWGSIVYYTFKKLGTVSGGSQFGEGDFACDESSGKNHKKAFWRGRNHTRLERNERAVAARQESLEKRIDAAIEHDSSLGLLGAKGGVAKRRKKFVLGAS